MIAFRNLVSEGNKSLKQRRSAPDINGVGERGKRSSYDSVTKRGLERGPKLGGPLSICFIHDQVLPNCNQSMFR
jgi:hypothetical protein